jgi:hypothetical protein
LSSLEFFGKGLISDSILSVEFDKGVDDVWINKLFVERRNLLATDAGGLSRRVRLPVGTGSGCLTGLTGAEADFRGSGCCCKVDDFGDSEAGVDDAEFLTSLLNVFLGGKK